MWHVCRVARALKGQRVPARVCSGGIVVKALRFTVLGGALVLVLAQAAPGVASPTPPPLNVRATQDQNSLYMSADRLAAGRDSDPPLGRCGTEPRRQNCRALALDRRNPAVPTAA